MTAAPTASITQAIDRGDIDVWTIDIDQQTPDAWHGVVSADEFVRADRFIRQADRNRFLQARYSLRTLLARYAGQAASTLVFDCNAHGKPALAGADAPGFNLSHSGNLAVVAIGRQPAIGIDIERIKSPTHVHQLARQVFSDEEYADFAAMPDDALTLPFLICWTRKEAWLKALGIGLTRDPQCMTVGLKAQRARLLDATHGEWLALETLATDNGAVISLAVCDNSRWPYGVARLQSFSSLALTERRV
jgi:4'-phosphopantetheinyl transferase